MPNCENCFLEHDGSYGSGRFCNAKCARGFSTKNKREDINQRVSQTLQGRILTYTRIPTLQHAQNISISLTEHFAAQLKLWIEKWLIDPTLNPFYEGISRRLKRVLILLRGEKCEHCGWHERNPFTKRIPLQLHHIDGNDHNNRPENLELLCPNCHALTENWGARNHRIHPDDNPRR